MDNSLPFVSTPWSETIEGLKALPMAIVGIFAGIWLYAIYWWRFEVVGKSKLLMRD